MSSSDPLSFFAGEDSSSSDSEEGDGIQRRLGKEKEPTVEKPNLDKLPSPDSLFANVSKPAFLHNPTSGQVNWDKLVKNRIDPAAHNVHASDGNHYAAIAPPIGTEESLHSNKVHSSLTAAIVNTYSTTSGEISAPPVRYSAKDVDSKFRTVSDRTESEDLPMSVVGKHALSDQAVEESDSALKKQKTENFRKKEKRKRDVGQTSRGKSYVEEEKRILRQSFATDEVMS